jgi:hypothetical protein
MRTTFFCVLTAVGYFSITNSHAIDFPPLGDRYANIPVEAREAYKSLKRLEAKTEIGINYADYSRTIGDTFPDVKLFLESRESRNLPELTFVLGNAMDCYREVNRLWGIKVTSGDVIKQYGASITLLTAQPRLWRVAAANLSASKTILEGEASEIEAAQKLIAANRASLTLEGGLQAAFEEQIHLNRMTRAKNTGSPVPPKVGGFELKEQLFPDGRIDDTFATEAMTKGLPLLFDNVPPASEEGAGHVVQNGQQVGLVAVFRYDDPAALTKAYDALAHSVGSSRKPYAGLGNLASVSGKSAVFRRSQVVVYIQGSVAQGPMLGMLAAIDARAREAFGEGEEIAGAKAMATSDLASLLLTDDDLKKGVEAGEFEETCHPQFRALPEAEAAGLYSLTANGSHIGCIAAVEFESKESAADHFATWTAQRRSTAKVSRASGLGTKSYRREQHDLVEFFFLRDQYLVYVNGPKTLDKELGRVARRTDVRIRGSRTGGKNVAAEEPGPDEHQADSEED